MKNRLLISLLAFSSLILFFLGVIVLSFVSKEDYFLSALIYSVAFFILNYVFIRYFIRKEIYEKVRTIYKNIYSYKVSKKDLRQRIKSSSLSLDDVNKEVEQWMEDDNEKMNNMIALEKFRKDYIGNVAHELRTPIFTIQGYVSTLLEGGIEDKNLSLKYLQRAEAGIDRMIDIVQDLDAISQLEQGEFPLNIINFDISALIQEVIEHLELKAKERKVSVVAANPEPYFVIADREKIRQVIVNLIENGIKYSKDNGGEVRIKTFDMDDQLLIEISDHGIGIDEKDVDRVFERFYRTDKARSRQFGGTGLGLSIVKHIIEAHDQTINIRSKLGQGTVFGFTLKKSKKE
ncbi:MAG: ATP-binding protein [Bacteroidales bacterium]|jgi:two-component system phosphate regulon sensor histidine kinase PhoR|nr:ATP-binding protein [Bacteroidales bacterium]